MPSPRESPSTAIVRCLTSGLGVSSPSACASPATNKARANRPEKRASKGSPQPTEELATTIPFIATSRQRARRRLHQKSNTVLSWGVTPAKVGKCGGGDMDGIAAGRLTADELERNFSDIHVPLDRKRALIEAS